MHIVIRTHLLKKIEIEKNKYTKNKKIQHHPTIQINVREDRKNNQQWTIQRNWQHRVHKTKTNKTKTQHKCIGHNYIHKLTQIT